MTVHGDSLVASYFSLFTRPSYAHAMVREAGEYLGRAVLISLDHDLYAPGGEDVGDGLEVARFLAGRAER